MHLEDLSDEELKALKEPLPRTLTDITEEEHPFSIPWSKESRSLLTGFDSSRMKDIQGPWIIQTPFDRVNGTMTFLLCETAGGIASYHDSMTSRVGTFINRMTITGTITVGWPFLSAAAAGTYDKIVTNNDSNVEAERLVSCRVGRIILDQPPTLNSAARTMLCGPSGATRFKECFGDFFICGYEIGADAAANLSAHTESKSDEEIISLQASVKILFVSVGTSYEKETKSFSSSSSLKFTGCNTLFQDNATLEAKCVSDSEQAKLQTQVSAYLKRIGSLDVEVRKVMQESGLYEDRTMPLANCPAICRSGLVVELLLAPFSLLSDYIECVKGRPFAHEE